MAATKHTDDKPIISSEEYKAYRTSKLDVEWPEHYPHKWETTMRNGDFIEKYQHLQNEEALEDITVRLGGRLMRVAGSSKKLKFFDLVEANHKIQLVAAIQNNKSGEADFDRLHEIIHRGDIVGVEGWPARSKRGELSVFVTKMVLLSPCLHMLPTEHSGLRDSEVRYRQRYIDLMMHGQEVRQKFIIRDKIITFLRDFLKKRDFIEVETPMMNKIPGGATARPFVTYHNELKQNLYMRIAPELYLKQLIVGGMERVFEIGKNFRNEGIDLTHNPEFTMCEFYIAYQDYNDLMVMTEEFISSLVMSLFGTYKIQYNTTPETEVTIDFTPPFKRVSFIDAIEEKAGKKLSRPLDSEAAIAEMIALCGGHKLELPRPATAQKLLDKLCGHFIEDDITSPTFIKDHPRVMSPLAKWHRDEPADKAERCELFVLGRELANFYTELNDPLTQLRAFEKQAADRAAGDDEACPIDYGFVKALEYGLPPTAGWGMGIDRLCMFLTNTQNMKEVILFPAMKPETHIESPLSVPTP